MDSGEYDKQTLSLVSEKSWNSDYPGVWTLQHEYTIQQIIPHMHKSSLLNHKYWHYVLLEIASLVGLFTPELLSFKMFF